eukprot:scaffold6568_cov173-Amphora_coffeaeformis.AAC.6
MDANNANNAIAGLLFLQGTISLCLFHHICTQETVDERRNRKRKERYAALSDEEKARRQRKIPVTSLPTPEESP